VAVGLAGLSRVSDGRSGQGRDHPAAVVLHRAYPIRAPRPGLTTQPGHRRLRLAGRTDITEAARWASRHMARPFAILDLTS
jgi:hypothetical protein